MAHNDFVSVTIVTYNSGRFIKRCLESVLAQRYPHKEIIVVDNASTDGTVDILEQFEDRCQVYYNDENMGFAAAQNQAIKISSGDWVLTLNPDVLLLPNFIQALVDAGQFDSRIGTVCGKLLTMSAHFEIPEKPVVDSTGIYFNPMLRHLDRGSQEVDNGHYLQYEYVFGATAAAALYRRAMIDDISLDGEFFDSGFLRLPRGRRRGLARAVDGLEVPLRAVRARLSRAQGAARQPARAAAGDQHALGEEPLPDAHQEHLRRSVFPQLVFHHQPRPHGDPVLPAVGAHVAEGLLVSGPQLESRHGQAPPDPIAPARGPRLHGELVPIRSGEQAGAQENGAHALALGSREGVEQIESGLFSPRRRGER